MNRTTAAALITTAVIGVSAGTVTAMVRGDHPTGDPKAAQHSTSQGVPTSKSPTTHPATPTTKAPGAVPRRLLYAEPGVIHDGPLRVAFDDAVPMVPEEVVPTRLVRASGGYLVSYDTSEQEPAQSLYFIDRKGHRTHLGDVAGTWALSPLGDRVAATDLRTGALEVLGLDGKVVSRWALATDTPGWVSLSWQRASVIVSAAGKDGRWQLYQWLPDTGVHDRVNDAGLAALQVSPDGDTILGQSSDGTSTAVRDENSCLSAGPVFGAADKRWSTCDWRIDEVRHAFSPDGDLVLARLRAADDAGPWRVAVMVAGSGPTDSMRVVTLPDRSGDVQWLDEGHLVTIAPASAKDDQVALESCDLDSKCTSLVQARAGRVVLGEQS